MLGDTNRVPQDAAADPRLSLDMGNDGLKASDDRDAVDRLLDQYGGGDVPLTALYLLVFTGLLRATTQKLVLAVQQLNENSKNLDRLNKELADANSQKAKQGTAKSTDTIPDSDALRKLLEELKSEGIDVPSPTTWGDLDAATSQLKAKSDASSNSSSQFQLAVQSNQSALANFSDQATNGLSKMWQMLTTIAGNFR